MINQIGEVIKKLKLWIFEDSHVFLTSILIIQKKERQFEDSHAFLTSILIIQKKERQFEKNCPPLTPPPPQMAPMAGTQTYRAYFYNLDPRCAFCGNEERYGIFYLNMWEQKAGGRILYNLLGKKEFNRIVTYYVEQAPNFLM